jgi:hypothetical protein
MDAGLMINWELRGISPSSQNPRGLEIVLAMGASRIGNHRGIENSMRRQYSHNHRFGRHMTTIWRMAGTQLMPEIITLALQGPYTIYAISDENLMSTGA